MGYKPTHGSVIVGHWLNFGDTDTGIGILMLDEVIHWLNVDRCHLVTRPP